MGAPEPDCSKSVRSNAAVVATYNRYASAYDRLVGPLGRGVRRHVISGLDFDPGDQIIELGCGPGRALTPLAKQVGPTGTVIGLDAAPAILERANDRVEGRQGHATIDLLQGDARSLPLPANSCDLVYVEHTLELFSSEEIRTVLDEIRRVLAPDGRLCVCTMDAETGGPLLALYDSLYSIPFLNQFGCRPIEVRQHLESAGFVIRGQERYRRALVWPVDCFIAQIE